MKNIKYFIYCLSLGKYNIPYISIEIRKIIWNYCFPFPKLLCNICKIVLIEIDINFNFHNKENNYCIKDGLGFCKNHYNI